MELLDRLIQESKNDRNSLVLGREDHVDYDPVDLKTPQKIDDLDKLLEFYGRVLRRVLSMRLEAREAVEASIDAVIAEFELSRDFHDRLVAFIYNDLRRLGIITVGHGGDWRKMDKPQLTDLGEFLSRCLEKVPDKILGALPIAYCYLREWKLNPQEAGFCTALASDKIPKKWTQLVSKAVELTYNEAPPSCIPYRSDVRKAKALLTSS